MNDARVVPPLPRRLRVELESLGLAHPSLAPLDTGWGPRDGLYLVTDGERRVVLKRIEAGGRAPTRYAKRVSMRREIATYRALQRRRWEHLRHPRLLATDGRTYLVLTYVDPATRWPPDLGPRVVQALFEFQVGLAGAGHTRGVSELFRRRSPWRVLLRATIEELLRGNRTTPVRIFRVAFRAYVAIVRASAPRLAQHGDATFGNVIVEGESSVSLVDFERVRFSERLSFCDAVQLAADPRSEEGFDPAVLRAYALLWCRHLARPPSDAHPQVRLALLLHVLYVLHGYTARLELQRPYQRFLDVVLSDARFGAWVERHEVFCDE